MASVQEVAEQTTAALVGEREKAVALHDYVRDTVAFGFNRRFEAGSPQYVLSCRVGHCNPKSQLLVTLLRAAGFEAHQHFVAISSHILKGVFPAPQSWTLIPEVSHSYVDVEVEGTWCAVDSFSIDTPLLNAAQAQLTAEGRALGYGVRSDSTNIWDGQSDAFSQFSPAIMIEDHGRIDDLEAYFSSRQYRNRLFGIRFNTLIGLLGQLYVGPINANLNRLRSGRWQASAKQPHAA
ncbi:MAG TPA: transglutaminase-like domain-containing protein [Acidimicrobiia bacterium]